LQFSLQNKKFNLVLLLFLATLAGTGLAGAQETGSLDSLASGFINRQIRDQNVKVKDSLDLSINSMLELEIFKDFPLSWRYSTLEGFGLKQRQDGLLALWRQNNSDFLAKPAADRSGEGLIPDIKVPLPGIGKVLGSGAQLKISGSEKMTIGGQQTSYPDQINTQDGSGTGNFALKIKQEQQVNLEGIIGERLHVLIDWNSEALTDKKSKIRLYYEGKEDEIIQRLEAGDTEFSLAGSSLIGGLSTQHKGLFGLKSVTRLGGLELTAIASKDEGQGESKIFKGSSQYIENKYNDKDFIAHRFFGIPLLAIGDSIVDIRVYVSSESQSQITGKTVWGINRSLLDFAGYDSIIDARSYLAAEKNVIEEFTIEMADSGKGYLLAFEYGLQSTDVLMVAYRTKGGRYYPDKTAFDTTYSGLPHLAVIKPSLCQPPKDNIPDPIHGLAWEYELRNFYNIGSSNILESSLKIQVKKRTFGREEDFLPSDSASGKLYTSLMGLTDSNGTIDQNYLRLSKGYFFFPQSEPFKDVILGVTNPAVYDSATLEKVTPQYQIAVSYLTKEAVFNLGVAGQLIEGSVQVNIGNETVPPNQYTVDYETGTVTFSEAYREKVLQAGTDLNINYQFLPWASFGTKTLAGLRGIYKFGEQAQLGGTWLYRSEQSLETKPRLGEEPTRMIVTGLDGSYKASPAFLTSLANYLPGVETEAASNFELTAEAAANFPNPNTKGEVYLDDMDGTKLTDGLNLYRQGWVHSSVPADPRFRKTAAQLSQKVFWYNPTNKVTQGELNPSLTDSSLIKDPVTTLKIHLSGATNQLSPSGISAWAGLTQLISKSGVDLSQSKLLNVWVRSSSAARLHIDLGREMNMDQVRLDYWGRLKGRPDTVDAEPLAGGTSQTYTDANDVGLDSVDYTGTKVGTGDDGNDDFTAADSSRCNGTEGNGIYDTEDLKLSGKKPGTYYKERDNYYTFTFDLSGSSGVTDNSGWRKFSVPLDSAYTVGSGLGWGNIYYARAWVDSCSAASAQVELALVEVSGNRWQEKPIVTALYANPVDSSEEFNVTVKNNKDDADYLPPPNAVENDEEGHPKFEQSLVLKLTRLKAGHLAMAQRSTNDREKNYTGYKKLKIWVNGHSGEGKFLLRLASTAQDSSPFYQYTGSLSPGWQELSLNLDDFSGLKKLEPDSHGFRQKGAYIVKGSPNLASIGALYLGVLNQDPDTAAGYSGEVWFDNLRLDEVRNDRGKAVTGAVRLGVADLLSLSLGYDRRDAYWYTMGQSPSEADRVSYNFGGSLQLDRFYLNRLGLKIPVTFGASQSQSYPWYGGDDRKLTAQESSEQMDWNRARNAGLTLSKSPSRWWLTNFTIDRISSSLSWNRNTASTRQSLDSNTTLNAGLDWSWAPASRKGLGLGPWLKLYYLPSSLSLSVDNNRTWHWNLDKLVDKVSTSGSGLTRSGSANLDWQIADPLKYTLTTSRNLLQRNGAGELALKYGLGAEVSRTQSVDYHTTISWLKILQPSFYYNTNYQEYHRTHRFAGENDSTAYLDVSNVNNLSLSANLEVGKWLSKIAPEEKKFSLDTAKVSSDDWLTIKLLQSLNFGRNFFTYFVKRWNGIDVSFSQSKTNSSAGLKTRSDLFYPDLAYQLGWRLTPRSYESYPLLSQERKGMTDTYTAGTNGSLGQLGYNAGFQQSSTWTRDPSSSVTSLSRTWPDLRFSLNSVERMFKNVKILTSASLTSNYSRRQSQSAQGGRGVTRRDTTSSWSPMISLNTRWKRQVNIQVSYDKSTSTSRVPDASFPSKWKKDVSISKKISASGSYAFSAPQGFVLKLWKMGKKRFKFKSDLNLGLQTSYSNTISAPNLDGALTDIPAEKYLSDKTEISVSPNATYNFTRNIKGELTGSYTQSTDKIQKTQNNRSYSLNTTVTITF